MNIVIACDHRGYKLKEFVKGFLEERNYEVRDLGTFSAEVSVDYPDYGANAASLVSEGKAHRGIIICGTGIGMSILANKFPGVRAALCHDPLSAKKSREHKDSNILVMGGDVVDENTAEKICNVWLKTEFEGGRHKRRINKISDFEKVKESILNKADPEVANIIRNEIDRQKYTINLIASENFASRTVLEAQGCIMTNKYAEGYVKNRYYEGCEFIDKVEEIAIERAKRIFKAEHANVQPHSGSQANMAVYFYALKPGDTILGMDLTHGGHLTHGSKVNFSGKLYNIVYYGVNPKTHRIDYDNLRELAKKHKPKLIIAGTSAYPRIVDFMKFREIADEVGAMVMADIAHIAGLVIADLHPSPIQHAEFVTSTTHKTLRGPRGGLILCKLQYAKEIDNMVFPGVQGGPLMHVIAAKAVAFKEAESEEFKIYQNKIVDNAKILAREMKNLGFKLITNGTDTHLILVDLTDTGYTGKEIEKTLYEVGITVNKNSIPFDKQKPAITSGIRLGTPAITTRGMGELEIIQIAKWIYEAINNKNNDKLLKRIKKEVIELCQKFPIIY